MLPFFVAMMGAGVRAVLTLAGLTSAAPLSKTVPAGGGNTPIVSFRVKTDGTLETALGDSGSALSYSQVGSDFVDFGGGTEYEIKVTAVSESGAAGSAIGTYGSFLAISTTRTFTWSKDTDVDGTATKVVDVEIREIALPANTVTLDDLNMVAIALT